MGPSLKVMVVTKENAAAHAFAKQFESAASTLAGREIWQVGGCHGAGKGPASPMKLDLLPGFRNTFFFFGLRCARCNNCGSHGVMLY